MRAYWFGGYTLPNYDGRPVTVGVTHTVKPPIVPCEWGLHASVHPVDALKYSNNESLWLVELGGLIVERPDKLAASERTYLAHIDATNVLRTHARWCASQVLHLWDEPVPDVVREYLETGNESIREEAEEAAWNCAAYALGDAARNAVRTAARAAWSFAALSAKAAGYYAREAVWSAAVVPPGSPDWPAIRDAASDAMLNAQRAHLLSLVEAAFRDQGVK